MSYEVLARKYRSRTFDEVVGQDHVAKTLKRAIESGRIAHAFLFTGTRGTGKTSMARILAKALNCEKAKAPTTQPCGQCESCRAIARGDDIDVIEIDAASNTGVDNVRDIIANSAYRPARSRFKVYIVDEVHMLSKAAFNALLKTLEEPPEHVKFILATTEVEKVLPTILSRCQRYDFRNIPTREIAAHLREITKKEKIDAEDDALLLIAKAGAGSMRDSLSLLDRLLSVGEKKLGVDMVEQLLGLPKSQLMYDLAQAMGTGNVKAVLEQTSKVITRGLPADSLVTALADHLRNLLILRTCGKESDLVEVPGVSIDELAAQAQRFDPVSLTQDITILEELRRHMRQSQSGRALLDATLVRMTLAEQFTPVAELLARVGGAPAGGAVGAGDGAAAQKKNPAEELGPEPVGQTFPRAEPVEALSAQASPPEDTDDDDLPRPGKVWDDSGPSLSELLARRNEQSSSEPESPARQEDSLNNIEPVTAGSDVAAAWNEMLETMKGQQGLHGVLSNAQFLGVREDQAVIRFSRSFATFTKMLEKNGKKDLLRENLSKALGKPVGVRFEVEEEPAGDAVAVETSQTARPPPATLHRSVPPPRAQPVEPPAPAPAGPPAIRITPELIEQMRSDPLVAAVMESFNATPVKIEEA
jgi:DNA polymerase III subunit gamma/tau